MKPDPPVVLRGVANTLSSQVLAEVRTPFAAATVGIAANLLGMLAQEFDRGAARLVEENAALIELFIRARLVLDEELLQRVEEAASLLPGRDLRVSALQAENDVLRALLVDVHAAIDGQAGEDAEHLESLIWQELWASTRRRQFGAGVFG